MTDQSREEFIASLKERARSLDATIRSLTPASLDFPIGMDEIRVDEIVGTILKEAVVMKSIILEGDIHVQDVKAPSFMGPDEAADTLGSSISGSLECLEKLSEADWRASIHMEGSDRWRGETRSTILPSFLKDFEGQEASLRKILKELGEAKARTTEVYF
jgi:hypothetical protein